MAPVAFYLHPTVSPADESAVPTVLGSIRERSVRTGRHRRQFAPPPGARPTLDLRRHRHLYGAPTRLTRCPDSPHKPGTLVAPTTAISTARGSGGAASSGDARRRL